jgi:hypothetical protein
MYQQRTVSEQTKKDTSLPFIWTDPYLFHCYFSILFAFAYFSPRLHLGARKSQ